MERIDHISLAVADRVGVIECHAVAVAERAPGVRTARLAAAELGATSFMSGITEFDPGASLPLHLHNCDESVTVLEGIAIFETDEVSVQLGQYDTTLVPTGCHHRFVNPGPRRMRILFVYGSIVATRTISSTGETFAIGSSRDHAFLTEDE